jgi:long-chain acyl-CoA synthetase
MSLPITSMEEEDLRPSEGAPALATDPACVTSFVTLFCERVEHYGDRIALRHRVNGEWPSLSWREMGRQVKAAANALVALGVAEQGTAGILSQNRPEWIIADLACMAARITSVPIYPTNTGNYARYLMDDAAMGLIFIEDQTQYDKIASVARPVESLILVAFDPTVSFKEGIRSLSFEDFLTLGAASDAGEEVEARLARATREDLATLIYTSGTTGEPKGVMITQGNILSVFKPHDDRLIDPNERDLSLCFLPLSHVFERGWTYYALYKGMTNHTLSDPKLVIEALQEVRPTVMCAVPRFYEKIYAAVYKKLQGASLFRRTLFHWAVKVGGRAGVLKKDGLSVPAALRLQHRLADALVLKKIRALVGGRIKFFPCAGAPLAKNIEEFFHACGIFIAYGYGLTETTATVTVHETSRYTFGTVGKPLQGIQVRIGEEGEIMVKGPTVAKGYYKRPEETARAFRDGWFHTGDAGVLDEKGCLTITDRIKDLIKTSGGKYVAPQQIESAMGSDPYIEQIAVVGDWRPYIAALIVPSFPNLEEYAREHQVSFSNRGELVAHPEVRALYQRHVDRHNERVAPFKQVKRFILLPEEFTLEAGEITPTMKVRRKQILAKYQGSIEALYAQR